MEYDFNFNDKINQLEWEIIHKKTLINSSYGSMGNILPIDYKKTDNIYHDILILRSKIHRLKKLKKIFGE